MRVSIAWTVYKKELRETLRDRRTLVMMIGLPLVLYPMLIIGMSRLRESQEEASEARASVLGIWGVAPESLIAQLREKKFVLKPWEGISGDVRKNLETAVYQPIKGRPFKEAVKKQKEDAKKNQQEPDHPITVAARPVVLGRGVDAILVVWPDFQPALVQGGLGNVTVMYDSVRPDSSKANDRLTDELIEFRNKEIERREKERGLLAGFSKAVEVTAKNVATQSRRAGFGLGTILPFLLITISFSGAFYAAIDTTAGEKERGTMQTLLCAPLTSGEIIFGKFLGVWTVALVAALANIGSMSLTFSRLMKDMGTIAISPANYATAFLMLLPVTLMVTAIFLAVGVFAKDFKDGQNFLTPVLMAIMLPSAAATMPSVEINAWTAFLPIGNIALLMRSLFVGEARADMIFLVMLASALYASLAVAFAARVFQRESILVGGKDTARGLFGIDRIAGAKPTPSLALAVFSVALVLGFYGSLALKERGIVASLLIVQYGFFLLPVIAVVAGLRFPWPETLRLRMPHWRSLLAGALLGCAGWAVAAAPARLLPPPESLMKAMEKFLLLDGAPGGLWLIWFAIAITPGLCEEILFRGFILSGMKRLGMWSAVLITALLFGLAHASIYRLMPTFILGALFGFVAWRSGSIVPTIVAHALNNGLIATITYEPKLRTMLNPDQMQYIPWTWSAAGAAVVALALWLVCPAKAE